MVPDPAASTRPPLSRLWSWRRVRFVLIFSTLFGLMMGVGSKVTPWWIWLARAEVQGFGAMLAFGIAERWPVTLPSWLSRWVAQLLAVVFWMPFGSVLAYEVTTNFQPNFLHDMQRVAGWAQLTFGGILFGPWIALAAMVRQREALAREQALAFQLERSELERRASDARFRLLQAQVQPHFLFNTLANVRALVRTGSPRAPDVLDSLVAYLRAAVPRLDGALPTLGQELQLVRAYLDLMHLRMPDRLQFTIDAEPGAEGVRCPPMTLLTLVENAVRHGIDPAEDGGRIEVHAMLRNGRCIARVVDTGVGLQASAEGVAHGLGTGLAGLRERLQLAFAGDARLGVTGVVPRGVCAEVEFPAERVPAPSPTSPPSPSPSPSPSAEPSA